MAKGNKERKQYTEEEKKNLTQKYYEKTEGGNRKKLKAAKELGVNFVTLEKWAKKTFPDWPSRSPRKNTSKTPASSSTSKDTYENLRATIRSEVIDEIIDKLQKLK